MKMREILVIREKDRFSSILIEEGFSVINFPLIKTAAFDDLSDLENSLMEIESFDGIFITSSKAAEIVSTKLAEMRKNFAGKFFVLGKRSADLLKKTGCEIFYNERATTAAELLRLIPNEDLKNKIFLLACGNRSLRIVPETLQNIARVREIVVYETIDVEYDESEIKRIGSKLDTEEIKAVCFFSPSSVGNFLKKFRGFQPEKISVAVIGKTTANFARDAKLRVDFVSSNPNSEIFAHELAEYLRN